MEVGAIDCLSGHYVTPSKAEKGRAYKCADCDQAVILRKGTVRKHHFAHKTVSKCEYFEHPNESQQHKDAKLRLAQRLQEKDSNILIMGLCPNCGCERSAVNMTPHTFKEGDEVVVEYRDPAGKYVADIAVLNEGKVRVIYEVKHTHQTTTDVRPEPWYEITTQDIFTAEQDYSSKDTPYYISCKRNNKNRWCKKCIATDYQTLKEMFDKPLFIDD
jgi:ssDNA-binding Zn-finger/Zn-ribbon topoisomerase 1